MRKIIEKELSFYRLDLHTGNVIYFSHAIPVKEEQYIDLDIKDIFKKIDELVEAYNSLESVATGTSDEINLLKAQIKALEEVRAKSDQGETLEKE